MPTYEAEVWYIAKMVAMVEVTASSKAEAERLARTLDPMSVEIWQTEPEWMGPNHVRRGTLRET